MLQIKAPALSQFTRGPKSLQVMPVPDTTTKGADVANNPADGTEMLKIQRFDEVINHKSTSVVLQFVTD
jgi:hypothetical protein